jgi:hypothetical protein
MYLRDSGQSKNGIFELFCHIDSMSFNLHALECAKTRPVTKGSPVGIDRGLHMVYGKSDCESDVDECKNVGFATTMGVIPEGSGSTNIQSDLDEGSSQLVIDEVVVVMEHYYQPPH